MIPAYPQAMTRLPFRIETSSIEPNYPLTRDDRDLEQLTDHTVMPFPAWTHGESVGWSQRTPVLLTARILEGAATQVRLMTARSTSAGVLPPARIDAYCGGHDGNWAHFGAAAPEPDALPDRANGWVEVPLRRPCYGRLALVLHARGSFLMLDEVAAEGSLSKLAGTPPAQESGIRIDEVIADSVRRLREQYIAANSTRVNRVLDKHASGRKIAWLAEPWQDLAADRWHAVMDRSALTISVPESWPASFVVGVANGSMEAGLFRIDFCDSIAAKARVFELVPVLAADGQVVPDALRVVDRQNLPVEARSMAWIYVTIDPPVRSQTCMVRISSDGRGIQDLRLQLTNIGRLPPRVDVSPKVGTWAYLSDKPIWTRANQAAMVQALASSGINVFVIHPDSIPDPGAKTGWEGTAARLRADLEAYRGSGTVLLYLAWDRLGVGREESGIGEPEVNRWLRRLLPIMVEAGYSNADWALYPMDEPGPEDFAWLLRVSKWIKATDGHTRIYANPGHVSLIDLVPGSSLQGLMDVVDIWQPLRGDAADRLAPILRKKAPGRWWIYQVGVGPAKRIPPACYRDLGIEAARLGAAGFGFWSFSDTGGSSAWDDLDGIRPDWAVVYEDGRGGTLSSRRWEALQQGIRDYTATRACEMAPTSPACASLSGLLRDAADTSGCR